jgi:transcriptional repressor NrdR
MCYNEKVNRFLKEINNMRCPNCGFSESKVIDSRPTDNGSIRRRRECLSCKKRFTTYEIIDIVPVFVIKKNGSKEMFDRNKVLTGLIKSCYKRPVTSEQLNMLVSEIESELQNSLKSEISSTELGVMVMERLRQLDEVSYVRFASVYREFKDVETFMNELKLLADQRQEG